jgi:RNA polymerase sigma-70 factor (ECF subfamily)
MAQTKDNRDREAERWQAYLGILAYLHLSPFLQRRLDLPGVVQRTLVEARERCALLRLARPAEELGWLRRILVRHLIEEIHKLAVASRGTDRSLALTLEEGTRVGLETWLTTAEATPGEAAQHNEQVMQVVVALAELTELQREALVLQFWHGWSQDEIGEHLGRTPAAVAGLIKRGLAKLRQRLPPPESPCSRGGHSSGPDGNHP